MVIKVYISSVTCNNQQRKNQHTILSKLQSEKINFVKIDITDPKHSAEKLHMQEHSKSRKEGTFPLPPQVFNELEYCGDYDTFADALETQNLWEFLKLKELQDQMKQKIEHDDSLVDFKKEGEEEEEKKDEEGGEKTNKEEEMVEAVKGEEKEEVKEEEGEKKEEKEEDTKETEAKEKSDEVEEKEEMFTNNEQLESQVEESEINKNAEPSKIVELEEPSKISEELARNVLIEVEELIVKDKLPNSLRFSRRIVLDEESLNQKYAGPMEEEFEKENKELLKEEQLVEVIEEVLQASSANKELKAEVIAWYLNETEIEKEENEERERDTVDNNVLPESVEILEVNENKEMVDQTNENFDNIKDLEDERQDILDDVREYLQELVDEKEKDECYKIKDQVEEAVQSSEILVEHEFIETHEEDTNDNSKECIETEEEFEELEDNSNVDGQNEAIGIILDEENDVANLNKNLTDESNKITAFTEDNDKENGFNHEDNQSSEQCDPLEENSTGDLEEETVQLQDNFDKDQTKKETLAINSNEEAKDKVSTQDFDDLENSEELIPTTSEEKSQKEFNQKNNGMEVKESFELDVEEFSNKDNLSEATEAEEFEQKTEVEEKVDKAEKDEEESKPEEAEAQE